VSIEIVPLWSTSIYSSADLVAQSQCPRVDTYIAILSPVWKQQLIFSGFSCSFCRNIKSQYNLLHCYFSVFIGKFLIFLFWRISFSVLDAKMFEIIWVWHVMTPCDITWLPTGCICFVRTGHWQINSQHFYQACWDNKFCHVRIYILLSEVGSSLCYVHIIPFLVWMSDYKNFLFHFVVQF
jgi:hypothetical protein